MVDLSQFRLKTVRAESKPFSFGAQSAVATPLFARIRATISTTQGNDSSIEVTLRGKSRPLDELKAGEGVLSTEAPPSGIQSMFQEIRDRSDRIQDLQKTRDKAALGSEQRNRLEDEINAENDALKNIVGSSAFKTVQKTLAHVEGSFSAGINSYELAGSLTGDVSLLGSDFIARVGNGDSSNLSLFGGYVSAIADAINGNGERDQSFFSIIENSISGALKALSGTPFSQRQATVNRTTEATMIAPLPSREQVRFGGSDGLALSIQGYIGSNAIQAAMAHLDYDPRHAVILLIDKGDDDERTEKLRKEGEEREAKLSAGVRTAEPNT